MKGHVGGGPGFNVFKALILGKAKLFNMSFTYPYVMGSAEVRLGGA